MSMSKKPKGQPKPKRTLTPQEEAERQRRADRFAPDFADEMPFITVFDPDGKPIPWPDVNPPKAP